jgi:hypothetical protein
MTGSSKKYITIPLKASTFDKIILHIKHVRVYLKSRDTIVDVTSTLVPIPPTYSEKHMIRFDRKQQADRIDKYESILVRMETARAQVDVYQINDVHEQIVHLST